MIQSIFADAAAPQISDQGFEQTLIMIAVAFFFFYFLIMRPESKRRKEMEAKRQAIKKGDKVIVSGGILGKVFKIQPDTMIIELHDGAKMEVLKAAIQDVKPIVSKVETASGEHIADASEVK